MNRAPVHVTRLRRMIISNVYLVDAGSAGHWLVDTGHRLERATLLRELKRAGQPPEKLAGVLLTHRHSDHAGNASYLRSYFGLALYAHRADARVLEGSAPRPMLIRGGEPVIERAFGQVENAFPSETTVVDRHLENGEEVAGFEVHWTPGHTEGSLLFRHALSGSLFTGDMLLNAAPPLTVRAGLRGPYPTFSADMDQARRELRSFQAKKLSYENLFAGHGPPLLGDARARVDAVLAGLG